MTKISMTKVVNVEAKKLMIHTKVCDCFSASLMDQNNDLIYHQENGYVPGFMPGGPYGDYIILHIDIDTGQITNWKTPTAEQIEEWIAQ